MNPKIGKLSTADAVKIVSVINHAAERYEGAIPDDRYSEPYMSLDELQEEMGKMAFYGSFDEILVGVIGLQELEEVTLIRHLYVLPDYQRQGIGTTLLEHALGRTTSEEILVGTWEAAEWAIRFYEKQGFELVANPVELLEEHWNVPERQMEESAVLRYER